MSFDDDTTEEHERRIVRCSSCRARIIFLDTPKGKKMPTDADSVEPEHTVFDVGLGHVAHWGTCPNSKQHKKK
jgi:hypothetical protein